jgi:hypothetical protein
MSRLDLPDADTLATLVSNVTKTMCGISFAPAEIDDRTRELCWRIATLSINGARPLRVALSSSEDGCAALGSALFSMPKDALDQAMIDDSLCEVLNMAAGQIKGALALDQALGLPKIVTAADLPADRALNEGVVLRSRGSFGLLIWITEV